MHQFGPIADLGAGSLTPQKKVNLTKIFYTARKRAEARKRKAQNPDWDAPIGKKPRQGIAEAFKNSEVTRTDFDANDLSHAATGYIGSRSKLTGLPRHPMIDRLVQDNGYDYDNYQGG
jgi:hypothetical protein